MTGDILFLVRNRDDPALGRLEMEFTPIRDGVVERKAGFSRAHTCREFRRLVESAGFADPEGYASTAREPYRPGAHRPLLVAARRPG